MKKLLSVTLALFTFGIFNGLFADSKVLFEFRQKKGESSVHVSTVEEAAYLNGYLNNKVEFVNRTSTTIKERDSEGTALLETHYMTTENYLLVDSGRHLTWGEEDQVSVYRTKQGQLLNPDNDFLPTVQSIPSFPDYKVGIGDSWQAEGKEVHDLRTLFNMNSALVIPFTATYTYSEDVTIDGVKLNVIDCYYEFVHKPEGQTSIKSRGQTSINSTYAGSAGYAKQKIYWDIKKGDIDHYTEDFQIQLYDIYGNSFIFTSVAHGEVQEYKSVNDDETLKKLQKTVDKMDLEDVTIKKSDKGLTISLENIQFEPDSDVLLPSEKLKLKKIAKLLQEYNNDLLITGHCAERGTAKARQKLSEDRAEAVAEFLANLGVRDEYHVFTQGKGSTEPIAPNTTAEGRAKNRRVEITLMD